MTAMMRPKSLCSLGLYGFSAGERVKSLVERPNFLPWPLKPGHEGTVLAVKIKVKFDGGALARYDVKDDIKRAEDFDGPPSDEKLKEIKKAVADAEERYEKQKKAFEQCEKELEEAKARLE